jgi:hypothetical protein
MRTVLVVSLILLGLLIVLPVYMASMCDTDGAGVAIICGDGRGESD